MQDAGFYPAGRAVVNTVAYRSVSPPSFVAQSVETGGGQDQGGDTVHHESFERMIRPFNPDAEEEQDAEQKEDHEEEEAVNPRVVRAPVTPSAQEVESHMTTHLPYRSWCAHCV